MSDEKSSKHPKGEYKVGYGRPPEATRFRPGESGNPHGRPKRQATFNSIANEELGRLVKTIANAADGIQSTPARKVIVRKIVNAALQGDFRAAKILVDLEAFERSAAGERGSHLSESAGEDHD